MTSTEFVVFDFLFLLPKSEYTWYIMYFYAELNAVEAAKKEEKERKKREKTAIVGDIGAMGDVLPTIELLMKKSSNINRCALA